MNHGSTFKIVTTAIGLEEAKTTTDKPGDFICTGVQKVYDWDIKCWRSYNPHGSQTLRQALENSCNRIWTYRKNRNRSFTENQHQYFMIEAK